MWSFLNKFYGLVILFTFVALNLCAQQIKVQDPILNEYLCSKYSLAMNDDCSALDTIKARTTYTGVLKIHIANKGISSADEVLYFANVDTFYLNQNNLTSFPSDISKVRSFGRLNIAGNQLKSVPNIHYVNDYGNDTAVKLFYANDNMIETLPNSWSLQNNMTQVIDLSFNNLTEIPDFKNYGNLQRLDLSENLLGFEYLIPFLDHPKWASGIIDLLPQKDFEIDIDTLAKLGDTILVDISNGLTTSSYRSIKNGSKFEENTTGKFEIIVKSEADLGEFWFRIYDEKFPDSSDFLQTKRYNIQLDTSVAENPDTIITDTLITETPDTNVLKNIPSQSKDIYIFSPNGDGIDDYFSFDGEGELKIFNKLGAILRTEELPFVWYGDGNNGKTLSPGLYIIEQGNEKYLKVLIAY